MHYEMQKPGCILFKHNQSHVQNHTHW